MCAVDFMAQIIHNRSAPLAISICFHQLIWTKTNSYIIIISILPFLKESLKDP